MGLWGEIEGMGRDWAMGWGTKRAGLGLWLRIWAMGEDGGSKGWGQ